ncbi:MAG TPA: hypothetical protein VMV47_12190 [Bacteroidales bacterium]|nr:hypothetical protein [Bacteroidales bacterium]
MEKKIFPLGNYESNRLVNIIKIIFGAVCIAVAVFWLIYSLKSLENPVSIWITIIFLTSFGIYQILAGSGKAERYISIADDRITLRKYILIPSVVLEAAETERIEFYALKVRFLLKSGKAIILRFGTTYYESNEKVIDEISYYAEKNKIFTQIIEEKI